MRRFLYYFPGIPGINAGMMKDLGIIDRFRDASGTIIEHTIMGYADGPESTGIIVGAGPNHPKIPEKWEKCQNWHLAVEDLAPRPIDLRRPSKIMGQEIELADGNLWSVPVIWRWDDDKQQHVPNIPQSLTPVMGSDGRWATKTSIRPEFAHLDKIASKLFAGHVNSETLPWGDAFSIASELLAVNYRLGIEEVGLLGLLDEKNIVDILTTAIDLNGLQEAAHRSRENGIGYYLEPVVLDEE